MGRIVKRLMSHQSLINRLLFVAPRVPSSSSSAPDSHLSGAHATVRAFVADQDASRNSNNTGSDPTMGGPASSYVKDQFLLTCSDDGTVHLYDFSPFSRVVEGAGHSQRSSSSQNQTGSGAGGA